MVIRIVAVALVAVNLLSFTLMGVDKSRAVRGAWRISEKALMISGACFGAAGGLIGMYVFRHKTKHTMFAFGFPIMLVVQAIALIWAVKRFAL